jgi:ketosteroid isomerase-like protein
MTTNDTTTRATAWNGLPAVVRTYLTAHRARDVDTAISTFSADASVTDEGHTIHGREQIGTWLGRAGGEYTFTTEFTRATTMDPAHVDVLQRLEGDFPGGVADLHYRFTLDGDLISGLVIEP